MKTQNMLISVFGTAFIALLLLTMSCDAANNPSALVGRWVAVSGPDAVWNVRLELLSDGTGIHAGNAITWKTENGRFYITASDKAKAMGYKLQGSVLTFTEDNGIITKYTKCNNDCGETAEKYAEAENAARLDSIAKAPDPKIEVTRDLISVDGKKVVKTAKVEKQDSFFIEELYNVLQSKRKMAKNNKVQIQIDPNMSSNVFFKIITTSGTASYTDISYTSKVNGSNHTERINFSIPKFSEVNLDESFSIPELSEEEFMEKINSKEFMEKINERLLEREQKKIHEEIKLTVAISKNYIEIWVRGGSLPKIFYKECQDGKTTKQCVLHKESREDPGKIEMPVRSVYDELAKSLINIHNRYIDSPDADKIVILADGDIAIWKVLQLHHKARTAGFPKVNFMSLN